jgi:hypothetical protein
MPPACGAGGKLGRDDWRRENVNTFVERVYAAIKRAKPWVKFGISPFGIWRPGNPPQIRGLDTYQDLYADSRKWLASGWVDYFAPQLYWAIDSREQSFPMLMRWWAGQNPKGRLVVTGLDDTKTLRQWKPDEILRQIQTTRRQPGVGGQIHWSLGLLMHNTALASLLAERAYLDPALPPASPWLSRRVPAQPALKAVVSRQGVVLDWQAGLPGEAHLWVLQLKYGRSWRAKILPGSQMREQCLGTPPDAVVLTVVDRFGTTSAPVVLERTAKGGGG